MSTVTNVPRGAQGFALLRKRTDNLGARAGQSPALRDSPLGRTSVSGLLRRKTSEISSEELASAESGYESLSQRHWPSGHDGQRNRVRSEGRRWRIVEHDVGPVHRDADCGPW